MDQNDSAGMLILGNLVDLRDQRTYGWWFRHCT